MSAKRDEYYTQLVDIEKELRHYKPHFKGKTVYCNCDDPYESNFFKYFASKFNELGLKRLITTSYATSPIAGEQFALAGIEGLSTHTHTHTHTPIGPSKQKPYKADIRQVEDLDGDGAVGLSDVEHLLRSDSSVVEILDGDGDFRSDECMSLLEQADIVVTNPPFSLFRPYLTQLMEHDKKFLIIGNVNAISYKEAFSFIRENRLWLGPSISSGDREFRVPSHYPLAAASTRTDEVGNRFISVKGVRWFTNLDHAKRHEKLICYKRYTPEEYPHYDNYDAINVDKVKDIPEDWDGAMGVPITFLDKYNPDQFEVLGITKTWFGAATKTYPPQIQVSASGQRSKVTKLNDGAALRVNGPVEKTYYVVDGNHYVQTYARILIRRRQTA